MKNREYIKSLLCEQILEELETKTLMAVIAHLTDEEIIEFLNNENKQKL